MAAVDAATGATAAVAAPKVAATTAAAAAANTCLQVTAAMGHTAYTAGSATEARIAQTVPSDAFTPPKALIGAAPNATARPRPAPNASALPLHAHAIAAAVLGTQLHIAGGPAPQGQAHHLSILHLPIDHLVELTALAPVAMGAVAGACRVAGSMATTLHWASTRLKVDVREKGDCAVKYK